jgi:hypothetical protein
MSEPDPDWVPTRDEDGQSYDETGRKICGSHKTKGGGWCRMNAGYGTDHVGFGQCKRHLGATPVISRGAFRMMLRAMGDPIQVDPAQAMIQRIASTAGHVAWLEQKVGSFRFVERTKLDDDGVEVEQFMTPNQENWWRIYREESDRLIKYSEIALRAGLAERTVKLAEQQGALVANAIDLILDGLRLTPEQLERVPDVVPGVLRGMVIDMPAIEGTPHA